MKFELDQFLMPYEFEERAETFVNSVTQLGKNHQDLMVVVANTTTQDIATNTHVIKMLLKSSATRTLEYIYLQDYNLDVGSTNHNYVLTTISSDIKAHLYKYALEIDDLAKHFCGTKKFSGEILDFGDWQETGFNRFALNLGYDFK